MQLAVNCLLFGRDGPRAEWRGQQKQIGDAVVMGGGEGDTMTAGGQVVFMDLDAKFDIVKLVKVRITLIKNHFEILGRHL